MSEKQIRKIVKSGKYSRVVVIPREFLRKLNWQQKQKVELELDEKRKQLVIRDAK